MRWPRSSRSSLTAASSASRRARPWEAARRERGAFRMDGMIRDFCHQQKLKTKRETRKANGRRHDMTPHHTPPRPVTPPHTSNDISHPFTPHVTPHVILPHTCDSDSSLSATAWPSRMCRCSTSAARICACMGARHTHSHTRACAYKQSHTHAHGRLHTRTVLACAPSSPCPQAPSHRRLLRERLALLLRIPRRVLRLGPRARQLQREVLGIRAAVRHLRSQARDLGRLGDEEEEEGGGGGGGGRTSTLIHKGPVAAP
jgi:hypothetical protein